MVDHEGAMTAFVIRRITSDTPQPTVPDSTIAIYNFFFLTCVFDQINGIKTYGKWTSDLHDLASEAPGMRARVRLEGPYGYDWAGRVAKHRLLAGTRQPGGHRVVFIAGGVGISPFASAFADLLATCPSACSSLFVLWSARDEEVLAMYLPQCWGERPQRAPTSPHVGFIASRAACVSSRADISDVPFHVAAAYNATVLAKYALLNNGTAPRGGWPKGQSQFGAMRPYETYYFGHMELQMRCEPGPKVGQSDPKWLYGQPLPCRSRNQAMLCPGIMAPLLSYAFSFLLALAAGIVFYYIRARATRSTWTSSSTAALNAQSQQAAPAASMNRAFTRRKSFATQLSRADKPQLYAAIEAGHEGGGVHVTIQGGRPNIAKYLEVIVADSNLKKSAVVDVYACGSEKMSDSCHLAYKEKVKSISRSTSFLPLRYAIG
eukprot:jgi/Mesvir1/27296/Mv07129-RA.1